ncbi:type IV pilus secretin PilQ [Burkholderia thailandensis]|uniref:Type II/III secretion system protein n=1 Tax=Burkholderia thailandensis (strain ATCC 700388 / DSM 13276 / CCUG 48851 / CIP 106301 / E264) TaxID=271848 RepID=Q2SU70_BURTA|nr:type IV pilus secretin PilQ [Burkholderia thailandensis]ABC38596.1 type II/III secretion system protein [Burkholderia thailandensis E264]AHI74405.1 type IV pilus secretin PilQ family protein [Burkholderia thailandensis 2002721723]AHI79749.1 type IV pilus secretin PilQ family protein [Burkholderia thailandensis E444]AIP27781.1 type IV pilus secretin PilQ family protein [Burkholderia thailandensis E264]AIT21693.1 type IV pilus secretin PilQ family protein [Burkholderia thailandensis E254]
MMRGFVWVMLGCAIGAAGVAVASPPPLPAGVPAGWAVSASVGAVGRAPLPDAAASRWRIDSERDAVAEAPTPDAGGGAPADEFAGDAAPESTSAANSVEPSGSAPAATGLPSRAASVQAEDAALDAVLEGPPVPLSPEQRMSDEHPALPSDTEVASAGANANANANAETAAESDDNRAISLNLQQASLAAVFDAFARFTGLNIVVSERVRGTVSLRLNNVRWRSAFDALLDAHGLAMARRGSVIWVAPVAELAERERRRFDAHARAAQLEPLASRSFVLRYARAADVQRLLSGSAAQRILSKRGSVLADPRTNLLFVTDLSGRLAQIADLIGKLDTPSRQVLIEARIVEGDRGFSRNLGARLALRAPDAGDRAAGVVAGRNGTLADLTARPISGFDAATAGLTLFAARASRLLDIELSALEAQGRGQIVSSPRVVTADRTKAVVEQGAELPYQAKVGNGVSGVQFRRATLKLEVEPQITPDGRVILDLDVAKDSVGEETASGPAIHTKHVQTRVEVENGGTVSIGGIFESDDRDDVTRVPLLGKIPVLGALFRHRAQRAQRSELVVYITPTVVIGP